MPEITSLIRLWKPLRHSVGLDWHGRREGFGLLLPGARAVAPSYITAIVRLTRGVTWAKLLGVRVTTHIGNIQKGRGY